MGHVAHVSGNKKHAKFRQEILNVRDHHKNDLGEGG
jgi:hypothetical protein